MKIKDLQTISEGLAYHIENALPLSENVYRPGSEEFFNLIHEARRAYTEGTLQLDYKSCEMMSNDLYDSISNKYPGREVWIEVSEDGENGSFIKY